MSDKELTIYGERDQVKELAVRLQNMMPGTVNLTQEEALTLAQIAIAHGLDPFNGEVWGLKGANGKWYGTMVGIKGLRKAAKRQAALENGVYWTETPRRVEPSMYGVKDGAIVYEIVLRDNVTMKAYGESLTALTNAGIPYTDAITMIGHAPCWIGVGIATPDEQSKMGLHARAKKRAEADAIKQRYDVSFHGIQYVETSDEIPEDAQMPTIETNGNHVPKIIEHRSAEQLTNELGYEADPPQENITDLLVYHKIAENEFSAAAIVQNLGLKEKSIEEGLRLGRIYRGWRDSGKDSKEATKLTLTDEIPGDQPELL